MRLDMVKGEPNKIATPESLSKGGKSVSIFKVLAGSLRKRKKCTVTCQFFEHCPVNAMSIGYQDKTNPAEDRKCLMKEFPHTVRTQFINLFLTGEEGIIQAIKTALHNYMVDVEAYGNLHDKRDMVQTMLQFYKEVYAPRREKGLKKEPLTITIRRVGMAPETLEINPRGQIPEGVTVKELFAPQNNDITEGDPESLIGSPMVAELLRPVNRTRPIPGVMYEEIKIESNMDSIMEEPDEN